MITTDFKVEILECEGDGTFFNFRFKKLDKEGGDEEIACKLYPIHIIDGNMKVIIYSNATNRMNDDTIYIFKATMPSGCRFPWQISEQNKWIGLNGYLTIQTD